ncbi:unnamed protein product, partial [Cyprideis torosa]
MVKITFPDGNVREYEAGTTALQVAESISSGLARNVLSATVNGEIVDATRPIKTDAEVKFNTWNDPEGKYAFWHSSAHLLAEALEALYPDVKFGIGPPIENGFYYDIDTGDLVLTPDDFKKIEDKMLELAREKNEYIRKEVSKADAIKYFEEKGDPYKLELIDGLNDGEITFYTQGSGLPIWLPKGTQIRERLQDYLRKEQQKQGYQMVVTPHIGGKELYVTSGHYAKYGEDSFQPIHTPREGEEFLLKPMNCPHHCEIYGHRPRSYKELPLRIGEFGTVYRYEQSGELHGLSRVRGFTQDDAHIFCTPEQLKGEFLQVLELTTRVLDKMGFKDFTAQISLRDPDNPDKYIGSVENWEAAEKAIIEATQEVEMETVTELGEAAFYGPKLDFMVRDALG